MPEVHDYGGETVACHTLPRRVFLARFALKKNYFAALRTEQHCTSLRLFPKSLTLHAPKKRHNFTLCPWRRICPPRALSTHCTPSFKRPRGRPRRRRRCDTLVGTHTRCVHHTQPPPHHARAHHACICRPPLSPFLCLALPLALTKGLKITMRTTTQQRPPLS